MLILWFRQLRNKFGHHAPVRRMIHVLAWILLIAVCFTVFFKMTEGVSWEESAWQMWQTATTVGYGNQPAESLAGRIVTVLAGTLGIAFVGVAISGAFDIRNHFKERRRLGMTENSHSEGYVVINWPGKENFRVLVEQLRAAEPEVGICVVDDRIEELPPDAQAEFGNLHFIRGSALDRRTWKRAGIRDNKAAIVFPLDATSADSDGTTKTIINLLSAYCGDGTRLIYVLVDPANKWMFEGENATDVWQNMEMLTLTQECHDRYSATILARMLSNTEGANPRTVRPGKVVGWTWGEFYSALHYAARETGFRVSPLALIHEGVGETCPDWKQRIEEDDMLAVVAYPGFDWETLENHMEKP